MLGSKLPCSAVLKNTAGLVPQAWRLFRTALELIGERDPDMLPAAELDVLPEVTDITFFTTYESGLRQAREEAKAAQEEQRAKYKAHREAQARRHIGGLSQEGLDAFIASITPR